MNYDYDPEMGFDPDEDDYSYSDDSDDYDWEEEGEDSSDLDEYEERRPFFDEEEDDQYSADDDLSEFFRSDPMRAISAISDHAAQQAEQRVLSQYAPIVEKMARGTVEREVFGRIPSEAKEAARGLLGSLNPVELAHLNEDGLNALANMAIGQAFWEGRLQGPRPPQMGEPVGGRGRMIRLSSGVTPADLDGYQRMTGRPVDSKWLRANGYSR